MQVVGLEFRDTDPVLDGRVCVDRTLTRCARDYHGSGPIRLVNRRIAANADWGALAAPANTVRKGQAPRPVIG